MRGIKLIVLIIGLVMFSSFVNADLGDNIISYWKMEDTTDSVGSNTLATTGDPTITTGIINNGYAFDGNDEVYASNDNTLNFDATDSFSVSVWIKMNDDTENKNSIFTKMAQNNQEGYRLFYYGSTNNYLEFSIEQPDDTNAVVQSDTDLDTGWHHVVVVRDAGVDIRIYVDGVLDCTPVADGLTASLTNTRPFVIGHDDRSTSADWFIGIIDEIGIWGRALTSTEVSNLYASGSPGSEQQYPFSSCGGCVYCGTGDWIIEESCHITESTKIETGYGLYVTSGYTVIIDSGVTVN